MATTLISDLWVPDIWIEGVNEAMKFYPAFINSGVVARNPLLDGIATGGGKIANIPYFRDITDQVDTVQGENVAVTTNKITAGKNVATILNREAGWDVTALAAAVSGSDVVAGITTQLGLRRQKARQATALAILRGTMGTSGALAGAGALSANRNDIFIEDGTAATAVNKITTASINATIALMGENSSLILRGAILMHPTIHAALKTIDSTAFAVEKPSGASFTIPTYQGIPVYESSLLVRAGGTSGSVYETYILGPGVVGWGEKPQLGDQIDVASLQLYLRKDLNNIQIYDRTRYLLHIDGTAFIGTPAAQSATNVELATTANWQLVYQSSDRIPVACLRSNG